MNQRPCHYAVTAVFCGLLAAAVLDAKPSGRPQEPSAQVEMAVRALLRGSGYERLADDPEFRKALREWLGKDLAAHVPGSQKPVDGVGEGFSPSHSGSREGVKPSPTSTTEGPKTVDGVADPAGTSGTAASAKPPTNTPVKPPLPPPPEPPDKKPPVKPVPPAGADEKLTGDEIMRRQKARHESAVEREGIIMVLIDAKNNQEKRNLKRWSKRSPDGLFNYLIYFEAPANVRGVVLLTKQKEGRDDDQWQYLPAAGAKMRRIAGGNRRSAFMGTDFAFEDLRSEKLEAHSYTLLREEKLEGETCYVIEAAAVSPEEKESTGYSRRVFWIRKDHLTTMKTEYYDRGGRLLKTATSYEIKPVKGDMMRPDKVLMEHHRDNHKTLMGTVERDVISPIDDNVFTERGALDFK